MVIVRQAAWISVLLLAALLLLALSPLPQAARLEEGVRRVVAPVAGALHAAARPATDVLLHAGQLEQLAAENAELRRTLARTEGDLAALREERVRTTQAAALLEAAPGRVEDFITASVLARDPAPGRQVVLINRGTLYGVKAGQPVLGAGATLVGVVVQADDTHARVRLLSDRDSAVASLVQASRTAAALVGTGDGLRLDFVPLGSPVAAGDVVLTSALGGLLPPGLLAGKVTAVRSVPRDLHESIEVEPLANLGRLEELLVMTGFTPGAAIPTATPGERGR